ncbi:MAG TPA: neuromedin U [Terriglobales bacterium]
MRRNSCLWMVAVFLLLTVPLFAQDTPIGTPGTQVATEETPAAATNADELRKEAQNPIASLISVPVQNNSNFGISPDGRTQDILNIQPVIPAHLSENWNLITRIIVPIVYQPTVSQPLNPEGQPVDQGAYGFGDVNPTFFLSPAKAHKIIWGAGPTLSLPTATNPVLGQGKWGIGPSIVVLSQPGHWTLGALANNIWSVAGQSSRPAVNQMLFQYFINYNLKKGYFITWQPTITANWEAPSGSRWVVPYGGGLGRIMKIGFQPVNVGFQFYGNAVHPPGTSPWGMRLQIAFLFPKLTKAQEKMLMEQKLKQLEQGPPQQ